MQEQTNYVHVGEMKKCGHCDTNFQIVEGYDCPCKCHKEQNKQVEEILKEFDEKYLKKAELSYKSAVSDQVVPYKYQLQTLLDVKNFITKAYTLGQKAGREFPTPEKLAEIFHDTYETLAPAYGYETRQDTKEFDSESPNGRLMIAVCKYILETELNNQLK